MHGYYNQQNDFRLCEKGMTEPPDAGNAARASVDDIIETSKATVEKCLEVGGGYMFYLWVCLEVVTANLEVTSGQIFCFKLQGCFS